MQVSVLGSCFGERLAFGMLMGLGVGGSVASTLKIYFLGG